MQIAFTRMRSAAYSLASDFVRLMPAARDTLVGRPSARGALPPTVVTLMIRPPPRRFMWGMTSRHIRMAPITLRSKSACHASSPTFYEAAAADVPAARGLAVPLVATALGATALRAVGPRRRAA